VKNYKLLTTLLVMLSLSSELWYKHSVSCESTKLFSYYELKDSWILTNGWFMISIL